MDTFTLRRIILNGQSSLMSEIEFANRKNPDLPDATPTDASKAAIAGSGGPSLMVWLMMGVLVLLALAVIFVLPGVVDEYELPFTPRASVTEPLLPANGSTAAINPVSPFEEAQKARQRSEAQDVLASLLARQADLRALNIMEWAVEDYQAAVDSARLGDEAYRTQLFADAKGYYQSSDAALQVLQEKAPELFANAMTAGAAALGAGNALLAREKFTLALALRPDNREAQIGQQRAQTLDEVSALMRQAADASAQGDLEQAQTLLQQALSLDRAHTGATEQLAQLRTQISDNAFTAVMSQGFAALQATDSEVAIAAFERALTMRPGSQQALEAITQTRDQLAVGQITRQRNNATESAAQEQWEAAVNAYDAALAIDPNLVFAVDGKDYAQKRLQLDRLLEGAINEPARLADTAVHEQAVQVYYTGRQLENPGPRLVDQLDRLEGLLQTAQIPVDVQIISDNMTEVTLYQVGVLGKFERQTLSLKPGQYVAVGTRSGYRDVRAEFAVGFDNRSAPVTIACTEKVVAVNRR